MVKRVDGVNVEVLPQVHNVASPGLGVAASAVDQDQRVATARLDDPGTFVTQLNDLLVALADAGPEGQDL